MTAQGSARERHRSSASPKGGWRGSGDVPWGSHTGVEVLPCPSPAAQAGWEGQQCPPPTLPRGTHSRSFPKRVPTEHTPPSSSAKALPPQQCHLGSAAPPANKPLSCPADGNRSPVLGRSSWGLCGLFCQLIAHQIKRVLHA